MSPGITEEAGQTARGLIDALKSSPGTLALSLANIAMLVFLFFALSEAAKFRTTLINQNFEFQKELSMLLVSCKERKQ